MKKTIATLALLALCTAGAAPAATYQFAYQASSGVLSGRLTGTLQADHNTIAIDGISGPIRYNNVAGPALPYLTTASTFYGVDRAPTVAIDGSILDFLGCTDDSCIDGVLFDPDIVDFSPLVSTGDSFGLIREPYVAANWTISAVPEPATWLAMIVGFGLTGALVRRKRLAPHFA